MKVRFTPIFLATMGLLLSTSLSFATEGDADTPHENIGKAIANPQNARKDPDAKPKAVVRIKVVDLNNATRNELKKLPGIGDAEADKIIAGRPFDSKASLVTRDIISFEAYDQLRRRIIVLPFRKETDKTAPRSAPKK
jgi:DNA uptake protein ComE-like DNA-binding protein